MRFNANKIVSTIFSSFSNLGEHLGFNKPRPPGEGLYIYILLFFVGYLIADSGTFYMRSLMLPSGGIKGVLNKGPSIAKAKGPGASYFDNIKKTNIFNSDHKLAASKAETASPGGVGPKTGKPVKSSLPLELVGTIVHGKEKLSVATIQVRGKKEIQAYKVDEEIQSMAKIVKIERQKVIFRNLRDSKLEYIEIKEEGGIKMGLADKNGPVAPVVDTAKTEFSFQRTEIEEALGNLPKILQDAKAVPYIIPGSGGKIGGFKMVAIKPGSIYEKLGLKRGDVLKGVNGEEVNSPQKAMELYQALKNSDAIELEINRGGSNTTLNYNITE